MNRMRKLDIIKCQYKEEGDMDTCAYRGKGD